MILIAVGANLPGVDGAAPLDTCRRAASALDGLLGLRLRAVSRWYESAPIPPSGQPPYVNGAARLDGEADPAELLASLHGIEAQAGRVRGASDAARTLDLDLIAVGGTIRAAPDPVLPHPRAHLRAFVLMPLRDVAPGWRHPVLGATAEEMLGRLGEQSIRPLA